MKCAELVLLNMAMPFRIERGPTITRRGERSLETLEGHICTERLSYFEPTQKSVVFSVHAMKYIGGMEV
jgi:hypothetical protein